MSILSSIFDGAKKAVGKVAGIAAPFLPGPWGAVAGIASGMIGAGDAQNRANAYTGQMGDIAGVQSQLYQQNIPALMQMFMNEANGTVNPSADLANQLYSDDAINTRAGAAFDPTRLRNDYAKFWEETEGGFNSAVNAANADASRRGLGVVGNTGLNSSVGQIRTQQGISNTGFRRDLLSELLRNRSNYVLGQQAEGNRLRERGLASRESARAGATNLATGSAQGALGTLGGLGGLYESRANAAAGGVNNLIGEAARSGVFNDATKQVGGLLSRIFGRRGATPGINPNYAGPTNIDMGMTGGLGIVAGEHRDMDNFQRGILGWG